MIVNEKHGTVATSEELVPVEFGFDLNAKAFEILSAGIYSDKVRAIVRELSTNAADAHVAAGKPTAPFVVHLPNYLEPWFAVTDYGTGLSDDAIRGKLTPILENGVPTGKMTRKGGIYTTYFKSDKTESNDFTGCLGLGSKSPFAYTDSFTVESRFNGTKRIYSAFLSERRVPTVTLMSEEPTTEANGLTIQFPVKSSDFWAFQQKAQETLRWFKVRPTITGWNEFEFPQDEYLLKTESFAVLKSQSGRSYAVMGNIAYPIETHEFLTGYEPQTEKLKSLVRWGIELYVNVGDVDISASREKLSYDKRTTKFLRDACTQALADLEKEVTKDIGNQPTIWKARLALAKVRSSFQNFDFKAEWQGQAIQPFVKPTAKEVTETDGTKRLVSPATLEVLSVKSHRSNDRLVVKRERGDTIHADGTKVFLNDERGTIGKIRHYLSDKPRNTRIYLLSDYDQKWLDETGLSEVVVKASTLPAPPRQAQSGTRTAAQKAKVYEFVPTGNSSNGNSQAGGYWTPAEIDLDDGGVYVEILYFSYRMKDGEPTANPHDLKRPLAILEGLGKDTKLYGIRPADKAILDKSEGDWRTLREYALEVVKELHDECSPDLLKYKQLVEVAGDLRYSSTLGWYEELAQQKYAPGSLMGDFLTKLMDANRAKDNKKAKLYGELRQWALLAFDFENDVKALRELEQELHKKYPMLRWVEKSSYRQEEKLSAVGDYVALIDAQPLILTADAA